MIVNNSFRVKNIYINNNKLVFLVVEDVYMFKSGFIQVNKRKKEFYK